MTPADDILEDEPDDGPGDVVDSSGRRDLTSAVEEDGDVDVAQPGTGPPLLQRPDDDGNHKTDDEE